MQYLFNVWLLKGVGGQEERTKLHILKPPEAISVSGDCTMETSTCVLYSKTKQVIRIQIWCSADRIPQTGAGNSRNACMACLLARGLGGDGENAR